MKVSKLVILIISLLIMSLVFVGCTSTPDTAGQEQEQTENAPQEEITGSIVSLGSSAMQPLVDEAAKQFMAKNPKAQVLVQGGGSGTGLSQVSSGGADIGNSDVFAEEKSGIDAAALVDTKVCVVGMAAAVNKDANVTNLTQQQLIDIFTGKITNWSEVGGADMKIVLVNRPESSGTRATFKKYAIKGAQEAEGITEESSGTVRKIIGETPGAVGYLAFSYFDGSVQPVSLDGVEPTEENVTTGKYPIWAYEHSYTKGEPTGLSKTFLEYLMSDEVQNTIVPKLGYIPGTKMKIERDVEGNITQK